MKMLRWRKLWQRLWSREGEPSGSPSLLSSSQVSLRHPLMQKLLPLSLSRLTHHLMRMSPLCHLVARRALKVFRPAAKACRKSNKVHCSLDSIGADEQKPPCLLESVKVFMRIIPFALKPPLSVLLEAVVPPSQFISWILNHYPFASLSCYPNAA